MKDTTYLTTILTGLNTSTSTPTSKRKEKSKRNRHTPTKPLSSTIDKKKQVTLTQLAKNTITDMQHMQQFENSLISDVTNEIIQPSKVINSPKTIIMNRRNKEIVRKNQSRSNIEIVRTIQKRYELICEYQDDGSKSSVLYNLSNFVNAIDKNNRVANTMGIYASLTTNLLKKLMKESSYLIQNMFKEKWSEYDNDNDTYLQLKLVELNTSYYFVPMDPFVEENLLVSLAFLTKDHILVHQFNKYNDEKHSFVTFDGDIFCGYKKNTSTPLSSQAIIDINDTKKFDSFELFKIGNKGAELAKIPPSKKSHFKKEHNAKEIINVCSSNSD